MVDRVEHDRIAHDVPIERLEKDRAARLQALEEIGTTEAHQALPGTRQVLEQRPLARCSAGCSIRLEIVCQTVAGEQEATDRINNRLIVELAVRVTLIIRRNGDRPRNAVRKIEGRSSLQLQVEALALGIIVGIVLLNERARTPHHKEPHQLAPIIGIGAILEGAQSPWLHLGA